MDIVKPIDVVIADDNIFLAQALAENLNNSTKINVVNTFESIEDLIEYIPESTFDVLILDINFNGSNSLEYIEQIKKRDTDFKIIVLTTLDNDFIKQLAESKGVDLFKGKNSAYQNFDQTIIECFNSKKIAEVDSKAPIFLVDKIKLTETKIKIIRALYSHSGKTEPEIAQLLNISTSSLKTHKRQLYEMTNTKRITDLIRFGFKHGILIN